MASFSQRWPRMFQNMNDIIHFEAEVINLGLRHQVMAGTASWGKIAQISPIVAYNDPIYVLVARYDKFWPYLCLHYQFWIFFTLSGRFDNIAIKMPSVICTEMVHNDTICPAKAWYIHLWTHLTQRSSFWSIFMNRLWIGYKSLSTSEWQILYNTASNGPVRPHLVNGDHVWSRIWSMNDLDHIEAEVRNLGLTYQIMACMALWGEIEKFVLKLNIMVQYMFWWRDMLNSGHINVSITSFDEFRRFRSGLNTLRSRCQLSVNLSEMFHNDTIYPAVAKYVHLWPHLTQRSPLWSILKNWFWIGYVCLATSKSERHCIIWHLMVQYGFT